MCGRYVSATSPAELAIEFGATGLRVDAEADPNYNVAPTNKILIVDQVGETRSIDSVRWGLIPSWAKDPKVGTRMINARAENIATSGAFRRPFARSRCIVPATGFYEWRDSKTGPKKQPFYFTDRDGHVLAFAGLQDRWTDRQSLFETTIRTATIITVPATGVVATVHDRMPAALPVEDWDEWLDPDVTDARRLVEMLGSLEGSRLAAWPVSTAVGSVANNHPELIDRIPSEQVIT